MKTRISSLAPNKVTGDNYHFIKSYLLRLIDHTPYIVDFRSAVESPYDHRSVANTDTCSAPNKQGRTCFFSVWRLVRPRQDGERARQLAITLLGAKIGGRHYQERALVLTSLRHQTRCCGIATTILWFYELIDRQLASETVAQAQRRFVRRKLVNTNAHS